MALPVYKLTDRRDSYHVLPTLAPHWFPGDGKYQAEKEGNLGF